MSGEYQLRKDVDKVLGDIYDYNQGLRVPLFKEESGLMTVGVETDEDGNYLDVGTIDAIFEKYGLLEIDSKVNDLVIGELNLDTLGYVTETELNTLLASYATSSYVSSNYVQHSELSNLDISLTTLRLVPYTDNSEGVICFEEINKSIDELDIDLDMTLQNNGYMKIEANLVERSEE